LKESTDTQKIFNTIWDPIYEKDIALNTINMIAVQATRQMHKYGLTEKQMAMVAVKNRQNGLRNPYAHIQKEVSLEEVLSSQILCWPIKLLEACPSSDGACAVILASEEKARRISDHPAWILGIANCADTYYMGDRMGQWDYDFVDLAAESIAAQRAYRMAGISNPRTQIDVAEIYAPFSNAEIVGYEALGFCQRGEGGRFIEEGNSTITGSLPVNPSGGVQVANPIAATALIRAAEAALQVMDKAGDHQIPGAEISVCTGAGGSSQFYTVAVFGKHLR
jgi:acetyl-CoA C-acetyltransferase